MLPILHLGPLAIQTPGLIILLGVGLGLVLNGTAGCTISGEWRRALQYRFRGLARRGCRRTAGIRGSLPLGFFSQPRQPVLTQFNHVRASMGNRYRFINFRPLSAGAKECLLKPTLDAFTSALAVFAIAFHLAQPGLRRCLWHANQSTMGNRIMGNIPASSPNL